MPDGYNFFNHDRKLARGECVTIYIKEKIEASVLNVNTIGHSDIFILRKSTK